MSDSPMIQPPSLDTIAQRIIVIRGQRVLLDEDLAQLYGVETRRLNEQVRRNRARFPADFIFELTTEDFKLGRAAQIAYGVF
jgi:ORF6N domain